MTKKSRNTTTAVRATMLTLAEIASAMRTFNDGDANAGDTLAAIIACVDAYRAGTRVRPEAA